jgi:hypothetical protein
MLSDTAHPTRLQPMPPDPPRVGSVQAPMVYVYERQAWEYKVVVAAEFALTEPDLDALGAEGWELTGVASGRDGVRFYFKRIVK